jgi:FMN-dependent NADH-azoreductase
MNHPVTSTLLHIDASPRGERSQSRKLGQDFLNSWRKTRADGRVISRDVAAEPPPFVSEAWVEGAFTPATGHSPAARDAMDISNRYIDELLAADEIVITTPIYNLSLPAVLKAWIDQIVRVGRTFAIGDAGFEGLAKGKRVIVIVASGSDFRPATPGGAYNFLEPYLRAVFGFIGITSVEFVYAHSLNRGNPAGAQAVIDARHHLAQLAAQAA